MIENALSWQIFPITIFFFASSDKIIFSGENFVSENECGSESVCKRQDEMSIAADRQWKSSDLQLIFDVSPFHSMPQFGKIFLFFVRGKLKIIEKYF